MNQGDISEDLNVLLARFLDFLYLERNLSLNTVKSYRTDLNLFLPMLNQKADLLSAMWIRT